LHFATAVTTATGRMDRRHGQLYTCMDYRYLGVSFLSEIQHLINLPHQISLPEWCFAVSVTLPLSSTVRQQNGTVEVRRFHWKVTALLRAASRWFVLLHNVHMLLKRNGKICPRTDHEVPEGEYRYSSTLSLTSALNVSGWLTPRPGRFTPREKDPVPIYRRLGRLQDQSGRVRKISPPPGFNPRTFQPVASRYTDWAILANTFAVPFWILWRFFRKENLIEFLKVTTLQKCSCMGFGSYVVGWQLKSRYYSMQAECARADESCLSVCITCLLQHTHSCGSYVLQPADCKQQVLLKGSFVVPDSVEIGQWSR
jgi:hypothetical protein